MADTTGTSNAKDDKNNEREKLRASLKQTLNEFKQASALKEKGNTQASQGGQKAANNRLVGNYVVGKLSPKSKHGFSNSAFFRNSQAKQSARALLAK
jgi:hypothetical protein